MGKGTARLEASSRGVAVRDQEASNVSDRRQTHIHNQLRLAEPLRPSRLSHERLELRVS